MEKKSIDISNIIGFGSAFLMLFIIVLSRGELQVFLSIPSIGIVLIGTFSSTVNSYSLKSMFHTFKVVSLLFVRGVSFPYSTVFDQLVKSADLIRKEGPLAIEKENIINDPFIKKGIDHIVDGTKTELILDIMEIENISLVERHKEGQQIFESMGSFAPAWGMIGTIVGLIFMLLSLDDPSKIGPAMATALLTTFYGALLANLVFLPAATRLENLSKEEILYRRFIIEGIISVANSENPRLLREKLLAFLSPEKKEKKLKEMERERKAKFVEVKNG